MSSTPSDPSHGAELGAAIADGHAPRGRGEGAVPDPDAAALVHLLELSCDWYWRLDQQLRMVSLEGRGLRFGPSPLLAQLGKTPWQWPGVAGHEAEVEALADALRRGAEVDDLPYRYRDHSGRWRYMTVSAGPAFDADHRFAGYRGTARETTQRRRAEALVALEHRVTRGLAEAATMRKVLQTVLQAICELEQWETGGFFRVENAAGATRLVVGWSGPGMAERAAEYYRETADQLVPPGGLLSRVAASGETMWVDAMTESQTTWSQRVRSTGEKATLFCPLLVGGKVMGIFAFASREIREPDEALLQTMRIVGEQVGQFVVRKEAEQVVRESEARFKALTQLSSDWYWETDAEFRFTRVEGNHAESVASGAAGVIGSRRWETDFVVEGDGGWAAHRQRLDEHQAFRDLVLTRTLGPNDRRFVSISGEPVHDHRGVFLGYRGIGRDITESKLAEKRIQHLATHDGLTGLPNRRLFNAQLAAGIGLARRHGRQLALLFIDLDGFKAINDAAGHGAGDAVLKQLAERLRQCLRDSDMVARVGGDEFVVMLAELDGHADAAAVARKILASLERPIEAEGRAHRVSASIGISIYGDDAADEPSLLRHADLAMYEAKRNGKNEFRFYAAAASTEGEPPRPD